MSLLKLDHLKFTYLKRPIINGLNLSISAGEMVAILGPSGSGKSTLLYLMGGMLKPDEGRVLLGGHDLSKLKDQKLSLLRNKEIGFVFQQFHLLKSATVLENVLLPTHFPFESLKKGKDAKNKAQELLQKLGIEHLAKKTPSQLSGGEQQRVAIARALVGGSDLILADEPTGNLDSKNVDVILDELVNLNREGKTVVIITHDHYVASKCSRVIELKDGEVIKDSGGSKQTEDSAPASQLSLDQQKSLMSFMWSLLSASFVNVRRTKLRSFLTMLGVIIGIASVLSMMTLGEFSKNKILESYNTLGVNKVILRGYQNWNISATDTLVTMFQQFDDQKDLKPLREIFPQIEAYSPVMRSWRNEVFYGGKSVEETYPHGVNHNFVHITNRKIIKGTNFSPYNIELRQPVCIIGSHLEQVLFRSENPIGKIAFVKTTNLDYACKIIGVLEPRQGNNEWSKPNQQILLPYTYFRAVQENWGAEIHQVAISLVPGSSITEVSAQIKNYFKQKYGRSGMFNIDSDDILIAQMKRFLGLFSLLLTVVAFVSLFVGGIGITNMMLVSLSERVKEIGIMKAVGATNRGLRYQFLAESIFLCFLAGLIGLLIGFGGYEGMIYLASKLVKKLDFQWVVNYQAIGLSFLSIFLVGILSGLIPAFKAEKLSVAKALRSD